LKVLLISKTTFQTGVFSDVTNIAYDATTKNYTITHSNNQTSVFGANLYYISILWG